MADAPAVLAVDQGTSATKAVLVDSSGAIVASGSASLAQSHPRPGWAEQDPDALWTSVQSAVAACLAERPQARVRAVGLSTQRESTLLWERSSGTPLDAVLSWQDARGADVCAALRADGHDEQVRARSGLPIDPMWSASKATWLLDRHDPDRARSRRGELCVGTVDSWLLWRLGAGHVVEAGNASRTQLLDLGAAAWDPWLCERYRVPVEALARVVPSGGHIADAGALHPALDGVSVSGVMGDSHAALFAHGAWTPGGVKATYGTGSSVMGVTERSAVGSAGICRSIAWQIDDPVHAVEGNIRSSGATLAWLARVLGTSSEELASRAATDTGGVHLVPAFGGLGAPWWDDDAVAVVAGMDFGTGPEHLARAALESIAHQIEDVVADVEAEVGPVATLLADGKPTANPVLMQLQADTSGRTVQRAVATDLSALGAAHLAGLSAGVWSASELLGLPRDAQTFQPNVSAAARQRERAGWLAAVARSRLRPADPPPAAPTQEDPAP